MKSVVRFGLAIGAAGFFAGCNGSQPPIGAPGTVPLGRAIATQADRSGPWMLPTAKSKDLLYVGTGSNVYVLSYPKGKLVGSLGISGNDMCSDKNGNVFIPTGGYEVLEYAHGGTSPIQTLDPGDVPLGCAVDPVTGNLAVTNEASGAGEVAIFPHAQNPPTWYRDPDIYTYGLCGYDGNGNLFVDGSGTNNYLAELPKGSSTFVNYPLGNDFDVFGSLQWDGEHMTLSNPTTDEIYRLKFGKSSFKVVGTTQIDGWQNQYAGRWPYVQTWLQDGTFVAQASNLARLGLWRYPSGGDPEKVMRAFEKGSVSINGVAISVAPSHDGSQPPSGAHKLPSYVYVGECCHFSNTGEVTVYDLALTAVARKITSGVTTPSFITVDRSGRLYTINQFPYFYDNGGVTEYDRGSEDPSRSIKLEGAWAAATDGENNLYVASCLSCLPYQYGDGSVDVYKVGTTTLLRSITKGIDAPVSLAIDADGNLYVANDSDNYRPSVTVYAPGSRKPLRTLTQGLTSPTAVALDPSNDLFVINDPVNGAPQSVVEFEAASNKVLRTITGGILNPQAIVLDGSGTLYVANVPDVGHGWISVYPSGESTPSYRIKTGVHDPVALMVDGENNLYVANDRGAQNNRGTVCVYAANAKSPLRCARGPRRLDYPSWLAVGP
jgi:hypothetical protein